MKCFVIADASKRKAKPVGALFWEPGSNRKQGRFVLELSSQCDEASLPLSLSFCLNRPGRRATPEESEQWVKSRIVPKDRHNISEVLRANGLAEYDALALLSTSNGRSSDDDFLVFEVDLPEELAHALSEFDTAGKKARDRSSVNRKSATRADMLLAAVKRVRTNEQTEYAVVAMPETGKPHDRQPHAINARNAAQHIGAQIRAQRLEAGLTQMQLAARIGISQVVLSRVETGAGNPTLALLEDISFALNTTLSISLKK